MANELNEAREELKRKLAFVPLGFGIAPNDIVEAIERLIDACIDAAEERARG